MNNIIGQKILNEINQKSDFKFSNFKETDIQERNAFMIFLSLFSEKNLLDYNLIIDYLIKNSDLNHVDIGNNSILNYMILNKEFYKITDKQLLKVYENSSKKNIKNTFNSFCKFDDVDAIKYFFEKFDYELTDKKIKKLIKKHKHYIVKMKFNIEKLKFLNN
jgi:hypothetical protein